jgi:hypothetical protein
VLESHRTPPHGNDASSKLSTSFGCYRDAREPSLTRRRSALRLIDVASEVLRRLKARSVRLATRPPIRHGTTLWTGGGGGAGPGTDSVPLAGGGPPNATSVRQLFGRRPTAVAAVVAIEEVARVLRKAVDAFRARQPGC